MEINDFIKTYIDYEDVFMNDDKYYNSFKKIIKNSDNKFSLIKKKANKKLEIDWIEIIEDCIPSIDKIIRNPRKFIENREEVLPIEISKNITSESIKHLSQHTNYISKIEGDKITPSKILNVFKDESLNTYENKFICTLINRLNFFIDKRYNALKAISNEDNYSMLKMNQDIVVNENEKLEILFEIKSIDSTGGYTKRNTGLTDFARVQKLNKVIIEFCGSGFYTNISKFGMIRPPIMRTNAIMKDKDLRKCLDLWMFIESYSKVGYAIETTDTVEKPSVEYINQLFGVTAIHYALFNTFSKKNSDDVNIIKTVNSKKAIVPKFVKEIYEEFTKDYNLTDTEFKKIMTANMIGIKKKKSPDEIRIRKAIDNALKEERLKCRLEKA